MSLDTLKENWEELGRSDAYWAVLTDPSKMNNKWDLDEFYQSGRNWVTATFKLLNLDELLPQNGSALDFGCGPGRLSQGLCSKFGTVVGTDISSTMIEKAHQQNKFEEKCSYVVNSTDDLSQFESNQFDFVMSFITLQHIEKKYTLNYIKEFSRVVKKGGYILFNVPYKPPLHLKILMNCIGIKGVNFIRQMYYKKKSVIEMHWIKEKKLKDFFNEINVEIKAVIDDRSAGETWGSNLYLLRKPFNEKS